MLRSVLAVTSAAARRQRSSLRLAGCCRAVQCRRHQSSGSGFDDDDLLQEVRDQAQRVVSDASSGTVPSDSTITQQYASAAEVDVALQKLPRAPAQFDLLREASVFKWETTAKYSRRIVGPMREWADEFQCRTGVHIQFEPKYPEKAAAAGYEKADDVEVILYFFGADKAVEDAVPLLKAMTALSPAYVRVGVYRKAAMGGVEWLTLRRVNRERRPADIPAVSLKTPGKYSMLFENPLEAATRTVYEETGIDLDAKSLVKTAVFDSAPSQFYWRPPVHYWVAELPEDAELLGPQVAARTYMLDWDNRMLRQSTDPHDRAWVTHADPKTGLAWLPSKLVDELQEPIKIQDNYMALRYTPPPASGLQDVLVF